MKHTQCMTWDKFSNINMLKGCFLKAPVSAINWYVVSMCGLREETKEKSVEG